MDWFDKAVALVWLALTYQQNRILRAGNPPPEALRSSWLGWLKEPLSHYWPTLIVVLVGVVYFFRPLVFPPSSVREGSPSIPSAQTALSTSPSVGDWRNVQPSPWAGPFGPIMAVELLQTFQQMPKPCVVKVTAPQENNNLRGTILWILQNAANCEVADNPIGPPNIDEPASIVKPTTDAGIVIHYSTDFGWRKRRPFLRHIIVQSRG